MYAAHNVYNSSCVQLWQRTDEGTSGPRGLLVLASLGKQYFKLMAKQLDNAVRGVTSGFLQVWHKGATALFQGGSVCFCLLVCVT